MQKAYPDNPHMNWYTSKGWEYLGTMEIDCNGYGVLDLYVNHLKKCTSYVFGNNGWDYMTCSYEDLFVEGKCRDWYLTESSFKDVHKEFLRRCEIQSACIL